MDFVSPHKIDNMHHNHGGGHVEMARKCEMADLGNQLQLKGIRDGIRWVPYTDFSWINCIDTLSSN